MKPLISAIIIIGSILSAMWLAYGGTIFGKTPAQIWDIYVLVTDRAWTYGGFHTIGIFTVRFILATWIIMGLLLIKLIPFWWRHRE